MLSRISEEFGHCPLSVALEEWLEAPCGLYEETLEARSFAATSAAWDLGDDESKRPSGPMADLVTEIKLTALREEIKARG